MNETTDFIEVEEELATVDVGDAIEDGSKDIELEWIFLSSRENVWTMEGTQSISSPRFAPPKPFRDIFSAFCPLVRDSVPEILAISMGFVF